MTKSRDVDLKDDNEQSVLDINGNALKCSGHWKAGTNVEKFQTAIGSLHQTYETNCSGPYLEWCDECKQANRDRPADVTTAWNSCSAHPNNPRLNPTGDPCLYNPVKQVRTLVMQKLNGTHIIKGNAKLTPGDVRQLHATLTSTGTLRDFMTYTMIIIGLKLFLCADELLSIKSEHFVEDHFVVHPDKVQSLVLKVKGKSDPHPVELCLFRDDECPEFCPVRHLLLYMKIAGIVPGCSGYLFPTFASLKTNPGTVRSFSTKYDYLDWLYTIKKVIKSSIPNFFDNQNENIVKIGTHTLRKTGYLFAVWGVLRAL